MNEWRYEYGKGWSVDEFEGWVNVEEGMDFKDELEMNGYRRLPSWSIGSADAEQVVEVYPRIQTTHPGRSRWIVLVDEPGGGGVLVAVNDLPSLVGLLKEVEILVHSWRDWVASEVQQWIDRVGVTR